MALPGVISLVLTAMVIAAIWHHMRHQSCNDLLEHSAALVERDLPLSRALRTAAEALSGSSRHRMGILAARLADGQPIAPTLREFYGRGLSTLDTTLIELGQANGTLGPTLRQVAQRRRRQSRGHTLISYPVVYGFVLLWILGGLFVFVVPRFQAILVEYNTPLPAVTRAVIAVGRIKLVAPLIWFVVVLTGVLLAWPPRRRPDRPWTWTRIVDSLRWSLPGIGREQRWRNWAIALEAWAALDRAGVDAPAALQRVSRLDLNLAMRRLLGRWADRAADGTPLTDCRAFARAPRLVQWHLRGGVQSGRLADALEQAADYCDGQFSRLAAMLRGTAVAVGILLMGGLFGVICWALIEPVRRLFVSVTGGG
jgi:type II secretory pathway component PulF